MEKKNAKRRDIKFFSGKNQTVVCVHSAEARAYARYLEGQAGVQRYEVNLPLELVRFPHLNALDIRAEYFSLERISDFRVFFEDGHSAVREIVKVKNLEKRAVIEQLELSRRYWSALGVYDWKIVTDTALASWKEAGA